MSSSPKPVKRTPSAGRLDVEACWPRTKQGADYVTCGAATTLHTWWSWSFLADYFILFAMAVVLVGFHYGVSPYRRVIIENDAGYAYPSRDDTISFLTLAFVAWVFPVVVVVVWQVMPRRYYGRSLHDAHHSAMGFLIGNMLTLMLTEIIKMMAGRLRPNWAAVTENGAKYVLDEFQSYPSGHASVAMSGLFHLSLWLCGKMRPLSSRGRGTICATALCFSPAFGAVFIAVSRTRDYKHDFADINAGMALGAFCSLVSYLTYHYSPTSKRSHLPKSLPKGRWVWFPPHHTHNELAAQGKNVVVDPDGHDDL